LWCFVCLCVCVCVRIHMYIYIYMHATCSEIEKHTRTHPQLYKEKERKGGGERVARKSAIWTSRYKESARLDGVVCDKTPHISPSEIYSNPLRHPTFLLLMWCEVRQRQWTQRFTSVKPTRIRTMRIRVETERHHLSLSTQCHSMSCQGHMSNSASQLHGTWHRTQCKHAVLHRGRTNLPAAVSVNPSHPVPPWSSAGRGKKNVELTSWP